MLEISLLLFLGLSGERLFDTIISGVVFLQYVILYPFSMYFVLFSTDSLDKTHFRNQIPHSAVCFSLLFDIPLSPFVGECAWSLLWCTQFLNICQSRTKHHAVKTYFHGLSGFSEGSAASGRSEDPEDSSGRSSPKARARNLFSSESSAA